MASTRFTQADITRALKGAVAAGLMVARVEVVLGEGKVIIFSVDDPKAKPVSNDWDKP